MAQVTRCANKCDQCGHEWLPTLGVIYTHCTSSKCRSRKWDRPKATRTGPFIPHESEVERNSELERIFMLTKNRA